MSMASKKGKKSEPAAVKPASVKKVKGAKSANPQTPDVALIGMMVPPATLPVTVGTGTPATLSPGTVNLIGAVHEIMTEVESGQLTSAKAPPPPPTPAVSVSKPGHHFVVQNGVLSEEPDDAATIAVQVKGPPKPVPEELKSPARAMPAPAPAGAGPERYFPPLPGEGPAKPKPVKAVGPAPSPAQKQFESAGAAVKPAPAPKPPKAPKVPKVKTPAGPVAEWGKVGTQAECYKRLLMTSTGLTDEQLHAAVTAELGEKAGPLAYVKWYRAWLIKHGHHPGNGQSK
jgi:hypothetical protein